MPRHCQCVSCIRERREFRRFMWRCGGVLLVIAGLAGLVCLLLPK